MQSAMNIFRAKLARAISDYELEPAQFAKKAGYSRSQVLKWLGGETAPAIDSLQKIADFFGIPAALLITEGPMPKVIVKEPTRREVVDEAIRILKGSLREKEPETAENLSEDKQRLMRRFAAGLAKFPDEELPFLEPEIDGFFSNIDPGEENQKADMKPRKTGKPKP